MNMLSMVLVIGGALLLIAVGLVSLAHDLLGRGPHDAPLIEDDGLNWPPRYQGSPSRPAAADKLGADARACHDGQR